MSNSLVDKLKSIKLLLEYYGSDHCPIQIKIELKFQYNFSFDSIMKRLLKPFNFESVSVFQMCYSYSKWNITFRIFFMNSTFSLTKRKLEPIKLMQELQLMDQ